jgi:hypothetical protein
LSAPPEVAHDGVEKEPPVLVEPNETVPVGTPPAVEVRGRLVTVAVQVVWCPLAKLEGSHETVVRVGARVTVVVEVTVVVVVEVTVAVLVTVVVEVVVVEGCRATPKSSQGSEPAVVVNDAGKSVVDETTGVAYSAAKYGKDCGARVKPVPAEYVQPLVQTSADRRKAPDENAALDGDVETEQPAQLPSPVAVVACAVVTPETSKA